MTTPYTVVLAVMFLQLLAVFLLSALPFIDGRSNGAPSAACSTITPGHGGSSQTIPGGFFIYSDLVDAGGSYSASQEYTITLQGDVSFKGFLIQARTAGTTTPIGEFTSLQSGSQTLSCSGVSSASVTHTSDELKSSVTFTWTSPSTPGEVEFRYAVVKSFSTYYANINAASHRPPAGSSTTISPSTTTSSSVSATPTNTPGPCPSTDKTALSSFPIVYGDPSGCVRDINCTFYWAMGPNNEDSKYLDVYMEGTAAGWIAVGFSENQIMASTDVLGCRVDSGSITVIDTWNPTPNYALNQADGSADGLCVHTSGYTNGKISCLFSRYSGISDVGKDFDLDDSYWIIRGYKTTSQSGTNNLQMHSDKPLFSSKKYNPLKDKNNETSLSTDCPNAPPANARYPVNVGSPGDDFYLGSRVNDDNDNFMDFQMEGKTDGWVAIGFSTSKSMYDADVFACKRESTGDTVNVIDTWNPSSGRTNNIDNTQSGICQHSTEYSEGRIKCTFSRYIDVLDIDQDLNLNTTLWQIYDAVSDSRGSGSASLSKHSRTPVTSDDRYNLVIDALTGGRNITPTDWPRDELIKTHGILMITAWILLAGTGIFFASWMKPTLPNGEWFQVHRAFMIASLFTGVVGFVFAFIANAKNTEVAGIINFNPDGVNTTHFAFGWIIIVLQVVNPIIAIFRGSPKGERRWIFNLLHGHFIGIAAEILAITNISIGLYLINGFSTAFWLFIVFDVSLLAFQGFLFIVYTINAFKAPEQDRHVLLHSTLRSTFSSPPTSGESVEMSDVKGKETTKSEKPAKKKPVKDAPVVFSWISASLYMVIVTVIVVILIVLIALI